MEMDQELIDKLLSDYEKPECTRKVEVSGFCKVEMSKLPFRQMTEAEIGSFQHEWTRTATHRSSF